MDFKDIRAFLQVCEDKKISTAAKNLYISPQGLSKQIAKIEKSLNLPLFNRTSSGLDLTEFGNIYKNTALEYLRIIKKMETDLRHQQLRSSKVIRIACSYTLLGSPVMDFIEKFKEENTDYIIEISETTDIGVQRIVSRDNILGLATMPVDSKSFKILPICWSRYVLLANQDNPLSLKETVSVNDLYGQKLIMYTDDFLETYYILEECKKAGFSQEAAYRVTGASIACRHCKRNNGISVMIDFNIETLDTGGLSVVPFDDSFIKWEAVLLSKKDVEASAAMQYFESMLLEYVLDNGLILVR